ncbi:MAG: hypothetical protein EOP45_11010 [Sphingobacteriaceae bacterium]|nr:MAG: hypothetical protein EOP45_11010 [Sphingobacteriaceae bacterium]
MAELPIGDFCGQCDHILERNGARCKNPSSCLIGCGTKCHLHANYHKYKVCDESIWTEQTAALKTAQQTLNYLRRKKIELINKLKEQTSIADLR